MATHGHTTTTAAARARSRRVEGQARGLGRVVEEEPYCSDVLTQVAATTQALQSAALTLLDAHLEHCVTAAVAKGGADKEAKLKEVSQALARLTRV